MRTPKAYTLAGGAAAILALLDVVHLFVRGSVALDVWEWSVLVLQMSVTWASLGVFASVVMAGAS